MEKVKVLVVEDETIIAEALNTMIVKMGYACMGIASGAEEAMVMAREKPDIVLLDIRLKGEKTGIWLAEQIKKELDIPYIFMTSFSDKKTVEQAASTMPYGYLVKPVKYENVFAAIATALIRFSDEKKAQLGKRQTEASESSNHENRSDEIPAIRIKDILFVKDEYQYVKITLADIDFIKSDGNYVEIHCGSNKKVIKETLKNFESRLDSSIFFQVHRSYIVNLKKIERIGGNYLMVSQAEVPVTKEKRDELFRMLNALQ